MQANPRIESVFSRHFLKTLYHTNCTTSPNNPVLQILAFEQSLHQPHSEIILRLSDGVVFIDCSLIGSYTISEGRIISADLGQGCVEFMPRDLVRLTDYFSKIDRRRICELRVMVLKMELVDRCELRIGNPAELRQYFENMREGKSMPSTARQAEEQKSNLVKIDKPHEIIKIQQDLIDENFTPDNLDTTHKKSKQQPKTNAQTTSTKNNNKITTLENASKDVPLTYHQIISGKEGFFLGRLLRIKMANKQTKDGPMSVLYLGFVDRQGQLVRVNMAGRLAMKQEKQLKKGRCYYIKDLQTYQTEKMAHPQIRLKDKQYKILQVLQPHITQKYAKFYYHWDHEHEQVQSDNVDIVGIIEDIEEKAIYPHSNQKREVVRMVVRNKYKTVKINFWAQQIKIIGSLKLKKRQPVLLEDIKKKKNIFLDFQYQSSIFKLDDNPALLAQLTPLLPSPQPCSQPSTLHELSLLPQPPTDTPTKAFTLRLYLARLQQNRIIYKLCSYCKRKVEKFVSKCEECGGEGFYYKYNCQMEFADWTGSVCCVAFQFSAMRIFGCTAQEINNLTQDQLQTLISSHTFSQFQLGLQIRNGKYIVRNADNLQANPRAITKACREVLDRIYSYGYGAITH